MGSSGDYCTVDGVKFQKDSDGIGLLAEVTPNYCCNGAFGGCHNLLCRGGGGHGAGKATQEALGGTAIALDGEVAGALGAVECAAAEDQREHQRASTLRRGSPRPNAASCPAWDMSLIQPPSRRSWLGSCSKPAHSAENEALLETEL